MTIFDGSQERVLHLDPVRHARVLGAPGTGKTTMLVEAFARVAERPGWGIEDVLVLAPRRVVAASLRQRIERRLNRAIAGTPVRTAASYAFAALQLQAAVRGEVAPRLLTGTTHDETVAEVIDAVVQGKISLSGALPFATQVVQSEPFRGELRDMGRVLDDFALRPGDLLRSLPGVGASASRGSRSSDGPSAEAPSAEVLQQWRLALELLSAVQERLETNHPGELSSSSMMREACRAVVAGDEVPVPRLVLVDDAGELGEGALALLSALARRGSAIWVFGDPDTATGSFRGQRVRALAGLHAELARRGAAVSPPHEAEEQLVVLERVHRHGPELRALVRALSDRVGTAGAGAQRLAEAGEVGPVRVGAGAGTGAGTGPAAVRFAVASTASEQLGIIAHQLRARHLGVGGGPRLGWSQMAVVCRSRSEAKRAARVLASQQVPTGVATGGMVLREHQIVRELVRLLQHALGLAPITTREVAELLGGVVGGLDQIALRRLRSAVWLQEKRAAKAEGREVLSVDECLHEAFEYPGEAPILDTRGARRLMRLGQMAAAGVAAYRAAATPREVLWKLWEGSGLGAGLQAQALDGTGVKSEEAHRTLDAVVGLFFALQRHEEADSDRPIAAVLEEILVSTVAEDSLAARSERETVTVTTPQGLIGAEFDFVCVTGLQEGVWPNLRTRGSLLGVSALERWLRGEPAEPPSRRDTMHDELRLLVHSVSRARRELLAVALSNEEQHPSVFFTLAGRGHDLAELPSSRITLRGAVAEMRRRLVVDPSDRVARDSLIALARAGAPGAHPDEWYGVRALSSDAPLVDREANPEATVRVSPSHIEAIETCPLNWVMSRLGGGEGDYRQDLGTLLHHALETAQSPVTAEGLLECVQAEWGSLRFEAEWQGKRAESQARDMAVALADYLRDFDRSEGRLLATESEFEVPVDFARLRGTADRLELQSTDGEGGGDPGAESEPGLRITVVDLKTGGRMPTKSEIEGHAQLLAYQLGVARGAFRDEHGQPLAGDAGGAKLLYVHPDTVSSTRRAKGETYTVISQEGLGEAEQAQFEERVLEAARVVTQAQFVARVEHHCDDKFALGKACALHIIPGVGAA